MGISQMDLLSIIALLAIIASFVFRPSQEALDRMTGESGPHTGQKGAPIRREVDIPGTHSYKGGTGFLKAFALNRRQVMDIKYWQPKRPQDTLNNAPEGVRACLQRTYEAGLARGVEVPDVLFRNTPLGENSVFFVLCRPHGIEEPLLVSLVHTAQPSA